MMSNLHNSKYRSAAKFLLEVSDSAEGAVTALSIQKLLYFAHGLMLAKYGEPLIEGHNFQAWKYGPVLEPLYFDLKVFGSMSIKADSFLVKDWFSNISDNAQECIRSVWKQFGGYSAYDLVDFSHAPDGPWYKVYNENELGLEIKNEEIKTYFKTKLKKKPNDE